MSSSMCRATLLPEPDKPLTMISRIDMGVTKAHLSPRARLDHFLGVMVRGLFLVLLDAAVELVGERIDGGVHVLFGRVGVDLVAAQHQRGLRLVAQLLHREHAVDVDQLLEMPRDAFEFLET
jgi:hypothetical protein